MNRKDVVRLRDLASSQDTHGDFRVDVVRRLESFHQWVDGKPLVANLEVTRSNGLVRNLLLIEWAGESNWYVVVFPVSRNAPLAELHRVDRDCAVPTLRWLYKPSKRDGRNADRTAYFRRQCGSGEVRINLPATSGDFGKFLQEVFDLVDNRLAADALLAERPAIQDRFPEGRVFERRHMARERSQTLVRTAKEMRLRERGVLTCEVCGFDFAKVYGETGQGFIEAHHTIPVADLDENASTHLDDIALVCANCHRMLHRRRPWLTMADLRQLVLPARGGP